MLLTRRRHHTNWPSHRHANALRHASAWRRPTVLLRYMQSTLDSRVASGLGPDFPSTQPQLNWGA